MAKELNKKVFSFIFLSIFFVKMVITVAPLIAITLDAKSVYAVIMQLEIESAQGSDKMKETVKEYFQNSPSINLAGSQQLLTSRADIPDDDGHFRSFYPSVPTPPPNS
jgi:hypothetical protein